MIDAQDVAVPTLIVKTVFDIAMMTIMNGNLASNIADILM